MNKKLKKNAHCVKKSSSSRPTRKNAEARAVIAQRFKYLLSDAGLKVPDAAKLLQVTERTVYAWISGRTAVPFAAYKLLRLLRWFELPGPWDGWLMHSGKLWSPEGLGFDPSDSAWWGILVRKAAQFDAQCRLNARLHVRVAELVARLDESAEGGTRAAQRKEATTLREAAGGLSEVAEGGEVLVTPQKQLIPEPAARPAGPEAVTLLVTRHNPAKTGQVHASWTAESLNGRWFNYDRGQTYRGAK